ncbi:hypothetical protein Bca52824_043711 [Brassica carinata]|uniref:Uncharacterized protein n=1 Tax=Brassica carinata TaxID=52824 RepID=A0A8X7RZS5_BRACI|nr:hypothetical protein Bca52824_043711 [Brassica carinata]
MCFIASSFISVDESEVALAPLWINNNPKELLELLCRGGPSVPCSTAKAVEWDAAWSQNLDLSGRAALGVHVAAYEEDKAEGTRPKKLQAEKTAEGIV